jgi:hypothetical protein
MDWGLGTILHPAKLPDRKRRRKQPAPAPRHCPNLAASVLV